MIEFIDHLLEIADDSKYSRWYKTIIGNAIQRVANTGTCNSNKTKAKQILGYCEGHHICPVSLFPQYRKFPQNYAYLTAKEHYICHLLLARMFKTNVKYSYKMANALTRTIDGLRSKGILIVNSRMYALASKQKSLTLSAYRQTPEGTVAGDKNPMYGKESANKNKQWVNNGTICKLSYDIPDGWAIGRLIEYSEENRKKLSVKYSGSNNPMAGKTPCKGRSWYHDVEGKSFYLLPDDPQIPDLIKGRSMLHKMVLPNGGQRVGI